LLPCQGLNDDDSVEAVRQDLLRALCVLDVKDYRAARRLLLEALDRVAALKAKLFPPSAVASVDHTPPKAAHDGDDASDADIAGTTEEKRGSYISPTYPESPPKTAKSSPGSPPDSHSFSFLVPPHDFPGAGEPPQALEAVSPPKRSLLFRLEWLLCYHAALALYHLQKYAKAVKMLNRCLSVQVRPI
jgi:hypothetical protein